jgi:hypothetical protein
MLRIMASKQIGLEKRTSAAIEHCKTNVPVGGGASECRALIQSVGWICRERN